MKDPGIKTELVMANVWPHGGRGPHGPHDMRIAFKNQIAIVQSWPSKRSVLFSIDQPNEDDNFTLLRVLFLRSGTRTPESVRGVTFKNARQYGKKEGGLKVSIKTRYSSLLLHPLPTGPYQGTVVYDEDNSFALITVQAMTLKKEPEPSKPKIIVTPDDPRFYESTATVKRIIH